MHRSFTLSMLLAIRPSVSYERSGGPPHKTVDDHDESALGVRLQTPPPRRSQHRHAHSSWRPLPVLRSRRCRHPEDRPPKILFAVLTRANRH